MNALFRSCLLLLILCFPVLSGTSQKKLNTDFLISSDSTKDSILIDTRTATVFEQLSIPGSLNIPLHQISGKTFLKGKKIVLTQEGYRYSALEEECSKLRHAGFDAWILAGGLLAWNEKSPLTGSPFALEALREIPPEAFFPERDYAHWEFVHVPETMSPDFKKNPGSRVKPGMTDQGAIHAHSEIEFLCPHIEMPLKDEKSFTEQLQSILPEKQEKSPVLFLFFNESGNYDTLKPILKKSPPFLYVFLKGGLQAFQKFLEQNEALQNPKTRKTAQPCNCCPK